MHVTTLYSHTVRLPRGTSPPSVSYMHGAVLLFSLKGIGSLLIHRQTLHLCTCVFASADFSWLPPGVSPLVSCAIARIFFVCVFLVVLCVIPAVFVLFYYLFFCDGHYLRGCLRPCHLVPAHWGLSGQISRARVVRPCNVSCYCNVTTDTVIVGSVLLKY